MVDGKIEALDCPSALKRDFKTTNMNQVFHALARKDRSGQMVYHRREGRDDQGASRRVDLEGDRDTVVHGGRAGVLRLAKRIVHADQQYAGMGAKDHAGEPGALFRGGDAYGLFKGERLCRFTGTFCDCLSVCCFFQSVSGN